MGEGILISVCASTAHMCLVCRAVFYTHARLRGIANRVLISFRLPFRISFEGQAEAKFCS